MPVSINNTPETLSLPARSNTTSVIRKGSTKTTIEMVDNALIELHSSKGATLQGIYKFILNTYNIATITKQRLYLLKKHLNELYESEELKCITGKGLSGRFKLVDRTKFEKKIKLNKRLRTSEKAAARKSNTTENNKTAQTKSTTTKAKKTTNTKRKLNKQQIGAAQPTPVIPIQTTPVANKHTNHGISVSMFDTPMAASQVYSSTPNPQTNFVPLAPGKGKRKRVSINTDVIGTPRSSLPGKKRKLQKRGE